MTEDIAPDVLKKTQDTLGKFIKKPVLTEKLLRKPPFRFLHDICTAAMKETGFFEGVLSGSDVKAETIKDKEAKIAFLQKVIAAVESANNVKLSVKPNKVVAGHEPVKTNEFLQALATALEKQAEVVSSKKQLRKTKPQNAEKKQEENIRKKNAVNKSQKPSEPSADVPSKDIKKRKESEKQPVASKSLPKKREKEPPESKSKKKPSEAVAKPPLKVDGDPPLVNGVIHDEENGVEGPLDHQDSTTEVFPKSNGVDSTQKSEAVNRPQSAKPRASSARPPSAVPKIEKEPKLVGEAENDDNVERFADVFGNVVDNAIVAEPPPAPTPPDKILAPSDGLEKDQTSAPIEKPQAPPTAHGKKEGDSGIVTRPRTAIKPPTARPASARPAAPRVRERGQLQLQEEVVKPAAGKVNLIVEQEAVLVDEEELVAVQTIQPSKDVLAEDLLIGSEPVASQGTEHGHLVSQILEAQKELEEDTFGSRKGGTEIEWGVSRGADATNKEVERLRLAIQTLTRSANPLGKLLEFVQEDVDTMQQELETWRNKNSSLSSKLEQERSLTDQSIEPLRTHLDDLQHSIDQQMDQIAGLKATVLRNDEKIVRCLTGL